MQNIAVCIFHRENVLGKNPREIQDLSLKKYIFISLILFNLFLYVYTDCETSLLEINLINMQLNRKCIEAKWTDEFKTNRNWINSLEQTLCFIFVPYCEKSLKRTSHFVIVNWIFINLCKRIILQQVVLAISFIKSCSLRFHRFIKYYRSNEELSQSKRYN